MRQAAGILIVFFLLNGCNRDKCKTIEGPRETRLLLIQPADEIGLNMVASLRLRLDTVAPAMEVIAQKEVHEQLDINTAGNELVVDLKSCIKEHEEIIMNTSLPEVRSLNITSAGEIASSSLIAGDTLHLLNTGLGDIDLVLHMNRINANIRSSGDVLLSGQTERLDLLSTASGDLKAFNLIADTVNLDLRGSSVVEVYTDGVLNIEFHSKATVNYRGTPVTINIQGDGTVTDANL